MAVTKRKFVSLFASMALAFSLMGFAPAAAFADNATTGSFDLSASAITVTTGSTTDLNQYVENKTANGDYHFDFVMNGSGASVNKHSGNFVGSSAGTYTVTVYMMEKTTPTGNNGKPCYDCIQLDKETITITVSDEDASYGFQGTGQNSIKVTSPAVTSATYNANTNTYTNVMATPTLSDDGYYYVTYQQNAGFKNNDGADSYMSLNEGNISILNDGIVVATLGDDEFTVDSATHATKTVVLKIAASKVKVGNTTIEFDSALHGNNKNAALGSTVLFNF